MACPASHIFSIWLDFRGTKFLLWNLGIPLKDLVQSLSTTSPQTANHCSVCERSFLLGSCVPCWILSIWKEKLRCKPKASKASRVFFLNARERTPLSGCFYLCRPQRHLADFQVMALTRLVRHSSFHGLTKPRTNKVLEKLGMLRAGRGAQCIHLKLASAVQRTRGRFLSWFGESINTYQWLTSFVFLPQTPPCTYRPLSLYNLQSTCDNGFAVTTSLGCLSGE